MTAPTTTGADVPDTADALVVLAALERRELAARKLRDTVARIVTQEQAAAPDEPLPVDTALWRHGVYTRHAEAWEALTAARRALGMDRTQHQA
jgi:hypothetical protein